MMILVGFLTAVVVFTGTVLLVWAIWAKRKKWEVAVSWKKGLTAAMIVAVAVWWFFRQAASVPAPAPAMLLPNYEFGRGINQVVVPMIVYRGQLLDRNAGGWVITPPGSEFRIDYDSPVKVEYIDGRVVSRAKEEVSFDGVRPGNEIFRLYGDGYATITIKREVYVNK